MQSERQQDIINAAQIWRAEAARVGEGTNAGQACISAAENFERQLKKAKSYAPNTGAVFVPFEAATAEVISRGTE